MLISPLTPPRPRQCLYDYKHTPVRISPRRPRRGHDCISAHTLTRQYSIIRAVHTHSTPQEVMVANPVHCTHGAAFLFSWCSAITGFYRQHNSKQLYHLTAHADAATSRQCQQDKVRGNNQLYRLHTRILHHGN